VVFGFGFIVWGRAEYEIPDAGYLILEAV